MGSPSGVYFNMMRNITMFCILTAKSMNADSSDKILTKKKGKDLKVLDPKSGQNLCKCQLIIQKSTFKFRNMLFKIVPGIWETI